MRIARTIAEARQPLAAIRGTARIGFVPTMGALHDGHIACFRAARQATAYVCASIFVNPTQFSDPVDLAAYPRPEALDIEVASDAGVDLLFVPSVDQMYPRGDATVVDVQGPAADFEGAHRPGHFRGVATVCVKLFSIVQPDVAFFGQKDAQQVAVIKRVVQDLNLDLEITVVPTKRDVDGLALSSRNTRLSAEERKRALAIPRALIEGLTAHRNGSDPATAARAALGGLDVDYVAVTSFDGRPTLVIAARVGHTRLIDNVPLDLPEFAGLSE